jgi:DNA-directed RNA polymerase subunit omega
MARISKDKLDEKIGSVYRLVLIAARRARQLGKGAKPLVKTNAKKTSSVALEEILAGKVSYEDESKKK